MRRALPALLLAAAPSLLAGQLPSPFVATPLGSLLEAPMLRLEGSAAFDGNSVDLVALAAAARIAPDFRPTDLLLVGGLLPGMGEVRLNGRGGASVALGARAGNWTFQLAAGAASAAAVQLPASAAAVLREGTTETAVLDTHGLVARGLAVRLLGGGVGWQTGAGRGVTLQAAGTAHLVTPVAFAGLHVVPLGEEPTLELKRGRVDAAGIVHYAAGAAKGSGYSLAGRLGITLPSGVRAGIEVAGLGRLRIDALPGGSRTVHLENGDLDDLIATIDSAASAAEDGQPATVSLPATLVAQVAFPLSKRLVLGGDYTALLPGSFSTGNGRLTLGAGWQAASPLVLRGGVSANGGRFGVLGGVVVRACPARFELGIETDHPARPGAARTAGITTALAWTR